MRKAIIAREILSLTSSRDRAESIAGDLIEEAAARNATWLCWAVANVTVAMFFRAFERARLQTLLLLCGGFLVWCLLYIGVRALGALAGLQPVIEPGAGYAEQSAAARLYLAAALISAGCLTGLVLGGHATRGGINAVMPLVMLWASAAVLLPLIDVATGTATWYCTFLYLIGLPLCYLFPLLAGGAAAGRRAALAGRGAIR